MLCVERAESKPDDSISMDKIKLCFVQGTFYMASKNIKFCMGVKLGR